MTAPYSCKPLPDRPGYWLFYDHTRCSSVSIAATAEEAERIAAEHNQRWKSAGAGVGAANQKLAEARRELGETAQAPPPVPTPTPPPVPAPVPAPIQLSLF